MFSLLKSTIMKSQYILYGAFLALFAVEDFFIYKRPFLFFLIFACIPPQVFLYWDISSASDFVAASPRYNDFQRKKYPLCIFLLTLIPYFLISGIELLIERYILGAASVDLTYPVFLGAALGAMVICISFIYKVKRAVIVLFAALFILFVLFGSMNKFSFMKIFMKSSLTSLIIGFCILLVADIIGLILHHIFFRVPVTKDNYYVARYYKLLDQIK
jgi:hypothetical protein